MSEIQIRAIGIPSVLHILKNVPKRMVGAAIKSALETSVDVGIQLMSMHVTDSIRTEKSTGALAESIEGGFEQKSYDPQTGRGLYEIKIGSPLEHAFYAAQEIGWSAINRNVFINPPGRWRFIGIRPPIPKHPFLENTVNDMVFKVIPEAFAQNWTSTSTQIQAEADEMAGVE